MAEGKVIKIILGVVVCVIILVAVLVSSSFSDIDYYQYGFLRRKSTGAMKTTQVYEMGHHLVGPDYEFKLFQSDAHFITINRAAVFTSDKLEVWVSVGYQYFIRKEELQLLHKNYDIYYEDIIARNALDALKVAATGYSTDEFIKHRALVETGLHKAVRERLGGRCCERRSSCAAGCLAQTSCQDTDRGLYVYVKYFQMKKVYIPSDVSSRYLRSLVLQEETAKADYDQQTAIVQKETEAELDKIRNEAAEVAEHATAMSNLITAQANANATALVEQARSNGLKSLYTKLGLTNEDHRSSFDYLKAIKDMQGAHLTVDYDQLIAGKL